MYCTIYQTYVLMSGTIDTLDVWIDLLSCYIRVSVLDDKLDR